MRLWALPAGVALLVAGRDAAADQAACVKTAERGQVSRGEGKLREAHKSFVSCSADCPAVIAKDCAAWAEQVLAAMPSIVVDAKDDAGHDVGDATLSIDGEVVAKQLDGKAIPLNPGSHTLVLQRNVPAAGSRRGPSVSETIIAKEGAKARSIRMVLPRADEAPATSTPPPRPANADEGGGGHSVLPWIVVGAGAVTVAVGAVFVVTAPELPANCEAASQKCTLRDGQTSQEFATDQEQAGKATQYPVYGYITMGVGGALILGGLLWHFLETPKPRNAMIAPWLQAGGGGLVARAAF